MALTRHMIRKIAFQTLFMIAANVDADPQQAIQSVWVLTQNIKDPNREPLKIPDYLSYLVNGVVENQQELDGAIKANLKQGWTINRLNRTDLTILRLGLFEILKESELPNKVAINEAIELAKDFGDDTSRRFINGILSNYVNESESNESDQG